MRPRAWTGRFTTAVLTSLLALFVGGAGAQAAPEVVHEQTIHLETETLDTYCGETAVFEESGKVTFTFVGMSESVFTFTEVIRGTYTLTFVDSSLGSLEGRLSSYESVHATAGGTFIFSFISNERQGSVRVHGTTTFVVSPDGTIRVQNETFDVIGCPF
jgi:hypothetical protein